MTIQRKKESRKREPHPRTVLITKEQRYQSREAIRKIIAFLAKTFPKAFNVEEGIHPLKIGIVSDILAYVKANPEVAAAENLSISGIRKALVVVSRRMDYLTSLKMRDPRVDLEGNEVAQISEEESKAAAQKIAKAVAKQSRPRRKAPPRGAPRTNNATSYTHRHSSNGPKRRYVSPYGAPEEGFNKDENQPTTATIKVKKRYTPRHDAPRHDGQAYNAEPRQNTVEKNFNTVEKNYNSESYNTEASTVERLKAKLGLRPRRDRFEEMR